MHAIACLLILFLSQASSAQDPPEGLQASRQAVEIDSAAEDSRIEKRLREILETTGRFHGVEVRVKHGVALLGGTVLDEAERSWIIDLASNTEGIAAVSSRLTVRRGPTWDMRPAFEELRKLWRQIVAALPRVLAGLAVLILVALFAGTAARIVARPLANKLKSELLRTIATKLVAIATWTLGLYLFLRVSGLTQVAMTIVGGTGLLGIVLGFAFRDIAENFLASVLISLQRPFQYGDTIEVNGHKGIVHRVTPRGTILMDFDGNYIQLANATVFKSTIKNFTANPNIRQDFTVGVGYDAGVSHAQEVILAVLQDHSAVLADPKPMVLVEELASSTINLRVYFWVDATAHSPQKVRSALMRMSLRALDDEDISMPDDAREIIFPSGVPVRMLADAVEGSAPEKRPFGDASDQELQHSQDRRDESTEAEGGLESETRELHEQARRSRQPEEGEDILVG